MMFLLCLACGLVLYAFYKWAVANNDYFQKKGVKFLKPTFLFGSSANTFTRKLTTAELLMQFYNEFPGEKIVGLFDFRTAMYLICDQEVLKQITIKDFDHFSDHIGFFEEATDPLMGNSLVSLTGAKWRHMRVAISPVFTGSKMRQMFEVVSECGANMIQTLVKNGRQAHEMKDLFSRYANDVIATAAFGIEVDSFKDRENDFYKMGLKITDFKSFVVSLKTIGYMAAPWLMKALNIKLLETKAAEFFKMIIANNFSTREKKKIVRNDLIQLLLQIKTGKQLESDENTESSNNDGFATVKESDIGQQKVIRKWSDDELMAQCFVFFFAGFETASTLLHFITYELALNPDIQKKLFEEIQTTYNELNGKKLTYEALHKMKYMDMVVSEGLRKWPPAPITDRNCTKDYTLNVDGKSIFIEKDRIITIPIYAFHHDPKNFPNPEKFDPERFSDDNKHTISNGSYIPFGIGPRNCIGSRFALMETKSVLYYLLLNFSLEPNKYTQIPLKIDKSPITFSSEKGVHLDFVPRFTPRNR